jgi:hypothetical protein
MHSSHALPIAITFGESRRWRGRSRLPGSVSIADSENVLTDPALYGSTRLTNEGAATEVRIWPGFSAGLELL